MTTRKTQTPHKWTKCGECGKHKLLFAPPTKNRPPMCYDCAQDRAAAIRYRHASQTTQGRNYARAA